MLKKIAILLVETNIWVSLGLALLVYPTAHMLSYGVDWRIPVLGFLVSMCVYTFDHKVDVLKDQWKPSLLMIEEYYKGKISSLVLISSLLSILFLLTISPFMVSISVVCIIFIGIAYGYRIIPSPSGKMYKIKDTLGSKIWFTAFVCALSAVGAPIVFSGNWYSLPVSDLIVTLAFLFAMIACNSNMYDIRDYTLDTKYGIRTLPTIIGVTKTKQYFHIINLLAGLFLLLLGYMKIATPHYEMMLWVFGNAVYLKWLDQKQSRLVYGFWIDATLFLPSLAIFFH